MHVLCGSCSRSIWGTGQDQCATIKRQLTLLLNALKPLLLRLKAQHGLSESHELGGGGLGGLQLYLVGASAGLNCIWVLRCWLCRRRHTGVIRYVEGRNASAREAGVREVAGRRRVTCGMNGLWSGL